MTESDVLREIERLVAEIAASKGLKAPNVTAETEFLGDDLPIDSLDLAGIVVQLEALAGHDPFSDGFIEFSTVGELAKLYAR